MKIKPAHYAHMKQAIDALNRDKIAAHKEVLKSDSRVKDQAKRLRWDLCGAAGLLVYLCDTLYAYLDDTHVDTALKAIVRELGI